MALALALRASLAGLVVAAAAAAAIPFVPSRRLTLGPQRGLFARVELAALLLRLAAVAWGAAQDRLSPRLPYTDVDYFVVTDGARLALVGRSPFERATFRYSPLLAWLCAPNVLLFAAFGKLVFCAADAAVGRLSFAVLRARGVAPRAAAVHCALFLLSPLAINVSSRGSADSLVCALVLAALLLLLRCRELAAAFCLGLAAHLRLFPALFGLPMALFLDEAYERECERCARGTNSPTAANSGNHAAPSSQTLRLLTLDGLVTWRRIRFTLVASGTFFALGAACVAAYGEDVLQHAFLYHLARADTRHNFSALFYDLYLRSGLTPAADADADGAAAAGVGAVAAAGVGGLTATAAGLAAMLPQLGTVLALGGLLHRDLPLCLFAQTMAFVAFNKVVTAQYFSWWACLLPLAAAAVSPTAAVGRRELPPLLALAAWVLCELHWLLWGFLLELRGQAVFLGMWAAGLLFLGANVMLLAAVLGSAELRPVFALTQQKGT